MATGSRVDVALAPVLGARKDGTAGVDSVRDLAMTVLGEFVLPAGGTAWTRTLLAALDQLGVQEKAARQALARMEGRWLQRERVGRETRWSLTPAATSLLETGAERIYGFGQSRREWDRRWVVLLASVPEADRQLRYRLAQGLGWAGFGAAGNGMWLSPWRDQEAVAADLVAELGVQATSFIAEVGALGSEADLVASAWDLESLRGAYDEFLDDTASLGRSSDAAIGELTALVHRWRRFPLLDPDLPTELLPADWPGTNAAARFAELRAQLQPTATDRWSTLDGGQSG